ncbi:hypothetical protein CXB51_026523 [Gossypium anomalum]|uniref:NAD(P)-binding domain-containing protein n=1 Tax=Gossypium anomalum TaxID=47600 RepID=A0A8J5Y312_9ROSI|nr:hypothetical protein CXB51_026523 [Gossypium anomalum]
MLVVAPCNADYAATCVYIFGAACEKQVNHSSTPHRLHGFSVLVTSATRFIDSHCSLALKKHNDEVLELDNFNDYYAPLLKRVRSNLLSKHQVFIVKGDLNRVTLLTKLYDIVSLTHMLHLVAQNIVGFVNLLEVAKAANPQSLIFWASLSYVYGLNTENSFSKCDRTDHQVSLYAAKKKAGEESLASLSSVYKLNTENPFSEHDRTDHPASLYITMKKASSSSVYGLNIESPFSACDRTDYSVSLYAATKKVGKEIAHTYNHIYDLSLTKLVFFIVYSPWRKPYMAYLLFTKDIT